MEAGVLSGTTRVNLTSRFYVEYFMVACCGSKGGRFRVLFSASGQGKPLATSHGDANLLVSDRMILHHVA